MQTERDPASYGLVVEYSSQLKDFAPALKKEPAEGQAGKVTMLGFDEAIESSNVRAQEGGVEPRNRGLTDEDSRGISVTRDLDAELDAFGRGDDDDTSTQPESSWTLEDSGPHSVKTAAAQSAPEEESPVEETVADAGPAEETPEESAPAESTPEDPASAPQAESEHLSLQVELDGLTPDLRRSLESLLGKVIELPQLKIRLKGEDLG